MDNESSEEIRGKNATEDMKVVIEIPEDLLEELAAEAVCTGQRLPIYLLTLLRAYARI